MSKPRIEYNYGGCGHWYEFDETLEDIVTEYQRIRIMRHEKFGRCLVLDDDLMSGEFDESYDRAMLDLLPDKHRRILILGGGDCSLADRLAHLPEVEVVTVVDIDPVVTEVCARHFGGIARNKIGLVNQNVVEYLAALKCQFDVIFNDLTDMPLKIGGSNFYKALAVKVPDGVVISQTGSLLYKNRMILNMIAEVRPSEIATLSRFIPEFMENWTFTRYQL